MKILHKCRLAMEIIGAVQTIRSLMQEIGDLVSFCTELGIFSTVL